MHDSPMGAGSITGPGHVFASPTAPPSATQHSIVDEYAGEVERLSLIVSELYVQLDAVLKPEYDGPEQVGGSTPAPVQSPVRDLLAVLQRQTNRLVQLRERLEV